MMSLHHGQFVAIVGPSGAGKDSLIMAARSALAADDGFVFARRTVTRESSAAEDHSTMSEAEFSATIQRGGFLMHWQAHGLHYGLPIELADCLAQGCHVVANISRGSIIDAETACRNVVVIHVTARPEVRAMRIAQRGRESEEAILARMNREAAITTSRSRIIEIINEGSFDEGAAKLIATLRGL
jgi:ribose 1,5-bisphosphokinase